VANTFAEVGAIELCHAQDIVKILGSSEAS
jgi:hypothetical protein